MTDSPKRQKEKSFSATELNKFCYCKKQWYYERIYGTKQLIEWRRERNEEMGWDAADGEDLFAKGRRFHEGYTRKYGAKLAAKWILFALAIAAAGYIAWMAVK